MRKLTLLLIAIIFAAPFVSMAQPVVGAALPVQFDFGIKVAGNFTSLDGDEWEPGYKPGFAGGLFFGVKRNRFGGQIEGLFSQVKYTGNGFDFYKAAVANNNFNNLADSNKKGEFAVSYLSIPVLLNVKVAGPLWFQVGPQFNNIISIKDKDKLVKDTKDLFKSGDFSGVLGLQLNLASLRLSARYIIGLSDVSVSSTSSAWKQKTIQLGLGWSFL
jgi:hypothetical protein